MTDYTSFDVAHLGNVELLTPKFDKSLWFFRDLLAMRVVAEAGRLGVPAHVGRVRALHDQAHRLGCRRRRPHDGPHVDRRRRSSAASPRSRRPGSARAGSTARSAPARPTCSATPTGTRWRIYYETERYVADDDDKPALKNQASAFPGRGVNARRLDHINFLAKDVEANGEFIADALGMRESERIRLDDGRFAAWWFHFSLKSYDVVYSDDWTKHGNRLHHIAFAPDTREDILKAADIFLENGIHIESGPHKHAINQTFFLYVWEPGGNRIEFANAGARLLLDPDSAGRGVDARRSARRARRGA